MHLNEFKTQYKTDKDGSSKEENNEHIVLSVDFLYCSLVPSSLPSPYFFLLSASGNHGDASSQQPSLQLALLVHTEFYSIHWLQGANNAIELINLLTFSPSLVSRIKWRELLYT
jgi:hypothetical protein